MFSACNHFRAHGMRVRNKPCPFIQAGAVVQHGRPGLSAGSLGHGSKCTPRSLTPYHGSIWWCVRRQCYRWERSYSEPGGSHSWLSRGTPILSKYTSVFSSLNSKKNLRIYHDIDTISGTILIWKKNDGHDFLKSYIFISQKEKYWAKYYQMKLETKYIYIYIYIWRLLNQSRWRSVERSSSVIETSSMKNEEIRS